MKSRRLSYKTSLKMPSTQNQNKFMHYLKSLNYSQILKHLSIGANILFITLLLFNYFNYLPEFWGKSIVYIFYLVLAINTAYLASKINQIPENQRDYTSIVYLSKYFFLLTLIILTLNQFLKRQIIIDYMSYITVLVIALGFLTFYASRNRVEKEIEDEKTKEKNDEKVRKAEFEYKFPRINKIWGLRSIVKWMYKEGWGYSFGLIVIILLYFFIEFSMFQYLGNYPDEYKHILAGKSLLEAGKLPVLSNQYGGLGYLRGAPISYLVAFFFQIFGTSLFVAKLVPIFLGFINLFLLNSISKNILSNKKIRFILLILFVFSSWLIFNHFYIRHYVFLEFSLIFLIYAMIKLKNNISKRQWKNIVYLIFILSINIINYFFMYDSTKYLIPFSTLFGFIYLFLFESHKIDIKQGYLKKLFHLKFIKKIFKIIIAGIIVLVLFLIFLDLNSLINSLLNGETNTGNSHFNFNSFFFGIYLFFMIFLLLGLLSNLVSKNKDKLIYFLIIPLLLLHYLSSESMQIMRVMVYLLPIFYLLTCYGFEQVLNLFKKNKLMIIILAIIFIITAISILQEDRNRFFSNGYPIFPGEIGYNEYEPMYNYLKTNLSEYTLICTEYENLEGAFFGAKIDYEIDFKGAVDNYYAYYYDEITQHYKVFYTDTLVIKNRTEYTNLISRDKKVCIILRPYANHFLENSDINNIKTNFRKEISFIGFEIYCND